MTNINKIIKEEINRFILNESLSSKLYHFTNVYKLVNIIYNNVFKLTFCNKDEDERIFNPKYKFYMCFTRQRDSRLGYSSNRNVRIELDGDLLNQNFKGGPVNFWGKTSGGKHHYMRNIANWDGHYRNHNGEMTDEIKFQEDTENEDRLFSNRPSIPNAMNYITRIDILMDSPTFSPIISWLLLKTDVKNIVHIYDDEHEFNKFNGKEVTREYLSSVGASMFSPDKYNFITRDAKIIEDLVVIVTYFMGKLNISINECDKFVRELFEKYKIKLENIDNVINAVKGYIQELTNNSKYGLNSNWGRILSDLDDALNDIGKCKDNDLSRKITNMIRHENI